MKRLMTATLVLAAGIGAACNRGENVERVPIGTDVQVTKSDGNVVDGRLTARDDSRVSIDVGSTVRAIDRRMIADVRTVRRGEVTVLPASARFREITLPARTLLTVRLNSSVASDTSREGEPVEAILTAPVIEGDEELLPANSFLKGVVVDAQSSGRVKGRARLALRFTSLVVRPRGDEYPVSLTWAREAESTKSRDVGTIGIGAVGGTIVGALVGGGKGAAAGAAIGGGAGTAVVLSTKGDEVSLPRGTTLRLQLNTPLDVRVPLRR